MKKLFISAVVLIGIISIFGYANREYSVEDDVHSRVIYDFEDVVINPDKYPDYSIEVFASHSDFIEEIIADENINNDAKINLYLPPYDDEKDIVYARYRDKVAVTNKYNIYPVYYIKFIEENGKVISIDSIAAAGIDFEDSKINRSFSGTMLYLNESESGIFQDIYGNFYNKDKTVAKQKNSQTHMKIEYTLSQQAYPDNSVAFSNARGIYFQFE